MLSWGPCWAKMSPHIFLLIFRRTVNRWKQLLYFCSLANSWIPGDIPGDGYWPVGFSTSSVGLAIQTTADVAAFGNRCFQPAIWLHSLSYLERKIPFDQVGSHLRGSREHLAWVSLALLQPTSGVHLIPCQHLFKLEQQHSEQGSGKGCNMKKSRYELVTRCFSWRG